MSIPDLAAALWRQRELLERLVHRMETEQHLLASGRTRFLGTATGEVAAVLDELALADLHRAASADALARDLGLAPGASLRELAAAVDPPWTDLLLEHRTALLASVAEVTALAEANRHLVEAGMRAVARTLEALGLHDGTTSVGYDARGRSEVVAGGALAMVDRSL